MLDRAKGEPVEITRKTDYALRMLAELTRQPGEIVSVRKAAEQNDIPYSFARVIQHDLALAGIVESVRGSRGGMRISIDPEATTLADIIEAVQGPVVISDCEAASDGGEPCPFISTCHFSPLWGSAERIMRRFFASITLKEVVADGLMPDYQGGFELVPAHR